MDVIKVRNVNQALPSGLKLLACAGQHHGSRAGATLRMPGPVATVYTNPMERVLFDPDRNANPFFHFFEALWILAGREDVRFLQQFNKRMPEFSDNGRTFHGAYGKRLRAGYDQIDHAIRMLYENPDSRRVALQIWDAVMDLGAESKDVPCNMMAALRINSGHHGSALDLTVFCRSNDMLWGAYGTNVVQFSMLQEYIAAKVGVGVGTYTQVSNDFHVYVENPFWKLYRAQYGALGTRTTLDPYSDGGVTALLYDLVDAKVEQNVVLPYPLFEDPMFEEDLHQFFARFDTVGKVTPPIMVEWRTQAFAHVVFPMYAAWVSYKLGQYDAARNALETIMAEDWRMACGLWFERAMRTKGVAA